jgi:hypothetical protein
MSADIKTPKWALQAVGCRYHCNDKLANCLIIRGESKLVNIYASFAGNHVQRVERVAT